MTTPVAVPITAQIECVVREIRMRERVYANRVAAGTMHRRQADDELAAMRAVLETLRKVDEGTRLI